MTPDRRVQLDRVFELRQTRVDQVIADMRGALIVGVGALGELQCRVGHFVFRTAAVFRNRLDHVPVTIARGEIHLRVGAARIAAQHAFDRAQGFDEIAPIDDAQRAQAADAVAHRHLIGGLLLVFRLDRLRGRRAGFGERLFDPRHRQRERITVTLQAPHEFRDERAAHRRTRTRHVGDDEDQILGILLDHFDNAIGPRVGEVAIGAVGGNVRRDASQVFDQRETQHDRNGPQFTDRQRGDTLICRDESLETVERDAPVAVRDRFGGNVVDARKTAFQLRQFPAIALGQMPARRADLLLDDVEIVEQPVAGRRDSAIVGDRIGEHGRGLDQDRFVFGQARQQPVRHVFGRFLMRSGQ